MKRAMLWIFALLLVAVIAACSSNKPLSKINTEAACLEYELYWYNDKCWDFSTDGSLPASEVDSFVEDAIKAFETTKFIIEGKKYAIQDAQTTPETDIGELIVIVYDNNGQSQTVAMGLSNKEEVEIKTKVFFFEGNLLLNPELREKTMPFRRGMGTLIEEPSGLLRMEGEAVHRQNSSDTIHFEFVASYDIFDMGNSKIEVRDNQAYLSGELGTRTYHQVKKLIAEHPDIKTLIMTDVPGSINDAVNMHTGRLLRQNSFTIKLLSNSDIASGGVDLFTAGVERIVTKGAKLGVHSWCCVDDLTAADVAPKHPAHKDQLDYFSEMLGKARGYDFYFYTLQASPFDEIYYMTDQEVKDWGLATQFIDEP